MPHHFRELPHAGLLWSVPSPGSQHTSPGTEFLEENSSQQVREADCEPWGGDPTLTASLRWIQPWKIPHLTCMIHKICRAHTLSEPGMYKSADTQPVSHLLLLPPVNPLICWWQANAKLCDAMTDTSHPQLSPISPGYAEVAWQERKARREAYEGMSF